MVNDLIHRQVAVIAATSTPAALAAKAATKTIPIVFEMGGDPIKLGLVASLNRPGGNVTGVTQLNAGLVPKELEILHELLPMAKTVALLVNPANSALAEEETKEATSAAQMLGLELHVLKASTEEQLDAVFANLSQSRAGGLVVGGEAFFTSHTGQLAALAVRHAVPTIYRGREFCCGRWSSGLRIECYKLLPLGRCVYRPNPQGRTSRRSASSTGNQNRTLHKPKDRQGARYCRPAPVVGSRRRGDRVRR
jgi:hypothetical protein